jgi:hypothetical protein
MIRRSSILPGNTRLPPRGGRLAPKALGWIPWQSIVGHFARRHGFIDPGDVLKRLRAFARPSEVGEPVELLRAGAMFHARGLVNTRAIQFNLDWVWPYWVEQQFNPNSESFIPRAFSFSHINLTHRNWTAVGLPDVPHYSIVDPRGLITPLFDGWSLDFWVIGENPLLPSKAARAEQSLEVGDNLVVGTRVEDCGSVIQSSVRMERDERRVWCVAHVRATTPTGGQLVVAARPYNPEGVSFIDALAFRPDENTLEVNGVDLVEFSRKPSRFAASCYQAGDVFAALRAAEDRRAIECSVGMATGAALFDSSEPVEVRVLVDETHRRDSSTKVTGWREELDGCARLRVPEPRWQRLYDTAVATLILHAPGEVYPGPYTYKRFWYRDAALILNALLSIGGVERTRRALDLFPRGQLRDGYFRSQEGEWDSNGQVLWIIERYCTLSGQPLPPHWREPVQRGADWILTKRMGAAEVHPGLLPAGFSAEHLGPNDFYYWDDFWGVAGLRAAAHLLRGETGADRFERGADEFLKAVLGYVERDLGRTNGAIPAAPERRMDSGAVGSLVADFPLQLLPPGDARIVRCAEWLLSNSFVKGGFFQNMIHSGVNAYLTLHVAQVLLRAADRRVHDLIESVAALASPTGQWPEAIHPRTLGGCMGDGQHVWAAAEWVLMMRNLFVREEGEDTLVIGAGVKRAWLQEGASFEGALTRFGDVSVRVSPTGTNTARLRVVGEWRASAPRLDVRCEGCAVQALSDSEFELRFNA